MVDLNKNECASKSHTGPASPIHSSRPFTYLGSEDQADGSMREQSPALPDGSEDWVKSPLVREQIELANLKEREPTLPEDIVDKIVPSRVTTLLAAHGGAGKSMLALQMAVCVATGRPFMSCGVQQAPVTFYSAEDDRGILEARLLRVLDLMGVDDSEVVGRLHLLDMTTWSDPALFHEISIGGEDGSLRRGGCLTPAAHNVSEHCRLTKSRLLIVDNASDVYAADENARTPVRQFMHSLSAIAREIEGGVMLLAHVDKETARYARHTESYSGSTAWHNSARSRLFLTASEDGATLKHEKANHGPKAEDITLCWREGVFVDEHALKPHERIAREQTDKSDMAVILRFLKAATDRGKSISASRTAGNTHKVLSREDGFPNLVWTRFWKLVDRALQEGLLEVVNVGAPSHPKNTFQVTAAGGRFLLAQPVI